MDRKDIREKLSSRINYFIFLVNIAFLLLLATNYQQTFEKLNKSFEILAAIAAVLLYLLTSKKTLELKANTDFQKVFSNWKVIIPNLMIFVVTSYLAYSIFFPGTQTIKIDFILNQFKEDFLQGKVMFYAVKEDSDTILIGTETAREKVEISFKRSDNINKVLVDISDIYKNERINKGRNILEFPYPFKSHDSVQLFLKSKTYKINLPSYIKRVQLNDLSVDGQIPPKSLTDSAAITIPNGRYSYTLFDKENNKLYSSIITIDATYDSILRFPDNSSLVTIRVPVGTLKIYGDIIGEYSVRDGEPLILQEGISYGYSLSHNLYNTISDRFYAKERNQNNELSFTFPPSSHKTGLVHFLTETPDHRKVRSTVIINNNTRISSDSIISLPYGVYLVRAEHTSNKPEYEGPFVFKSEVDTIRVFNKDISCPITLSLEGGE